jgi:DNA invertase Pin-like site-specific DNA recombinase
LTDWKKIGIISLGQGHVIVLNATFTASHTGANGVLIAALSLPQDFIDRNGVMAIIGYARTSTREQLAGLEAQVKELRAAGCERLYQEQLSSVKVDKRQELEAAIDYVREGDVFVITKIDRLARSLPHLLEVIRRLESKGVALRILSLNIDTGTASGKLMLNVMGAIAEFERELMLERQIEGIAAAKLAGKYVGRQPTARKKSPQILMLAGQGMTRGAIAAQVPTHVPSA